MSELPPLLSSLSVSENKSTSYYNESLQKFINFMKYVQDATTAFVTIRIQIPSNFKKMTDVRNHFLSAISEIKNFEHINAYPTIESTTTAPKISFDESKIIIDAMDHINNCINLIQTLDFTICYENEIRKILDSWTVQINNGPPNILSAITQRKIGAVFAIEKILYYPMLEYMTISVKKKIILFQLKDFLTEFMEIIPQYDPKKYLYENRAFTEEECSQRLILQNLHFMLETYAEDLNIENRKDIIKLVDLIYLKTYGSIGKTEMIINIRMMNIPGIPR